MIWPDSFLVAQLVCTRWRCKRTVTVYANHASLLNPALFVCASCLFPKDEAEVEPARVYQFRIPDKALRAVSEPHRRPRRDRELYR